MSNLSMTNLAVTRITHLQHITAQWQGSKGLWRVDNCESDQYSQERSQTRRFRLDSN